MKANEIIAAKMLAIQHCQRRWQTAVCRQQRISLLSLHVSAAVCNLPSLIADSMDGANIGTFQVLPDSSVN